VTTFTVTPVKSLAPPLAAGVAVVSAVAGATVAVAGAGVTGATVTGAAVTGAVVTGGAVAGAAVGVALLQAPAMSAMIGNPITKRFFVKDMPLSSLATYLVDW